MIWIGDTMISTHQIRLTALDISTLALCAVFMFMLKLVLTWIPNVHLGAVLIIVYTQAFRHKVLYIIYLYVLLEIAVFGFNPMWTIGYLYVWTILAGLSWFFRSMKNSLSWAVLAGTFGLTFGALMAPPFILFTTGTEQFFYKFLPYWVSGIPFDLIHCFSNFILCLVLWKPLTRLLNKFALKGEYQ
jgi:energy-coupling factor transport system substrate-specific component